MKAKFCYWNIEKREMIEDEGIILHWGVGYEEYKEGIAHYTVVFIADYEGVVRAIIPTNMQIINANPI